MDCHNIQPTDGDVSFLPESLHSIWTTGILNSVAVSVLLYGDCKLHNKFGFFLTLSEKRAKITVVFLKRYLFNKHIIWMYFSSVKMQIYNSVASESAFEPRHEKTNKMGMYPAKTQISLDIRLVWSESLLCAQCVAKDPSLLHADSEDLSDWADAQADLSLRWSHNHLVGFVMSRLICKQCRTILCWGNLLFCASCFRFKSNLYKYIQQYPVFCGQIIHPRYLLSNELVAQFRPLLILKNNPSVQVFVFAKPSHL